MTIRMLRPYRSSEVQECTYRTQLILLILDLAEEVKNRTEKITKKQDQVCSLIQLFAFCYYLLERCCFTIIQPISEVRAFDMFQSLNATGTPLTAIETFLYENDLYEKIGNLTLLPIDINSSASNKNWIEKLIYYRHLAIYSK